MAEIKPISIVLVVASIVSSAAHAQTPAYQAPRQRQCNFLGGQAQCGWGCTPRADAVCCGDSAAHYCLSENCYFQAGRAYCCPRYKIITTAGCQ